MSAAFDAVAASYDAEFTDSALGACLRQRVWEQLGEHFPSGSRVADLGCGTGVDAVWMTHRGVDVRGLDASPAMLEQARARALRERLELALSEVDLGSAKQLNATLASDPPLDGAYSSFGALNCVEDRRALAATLARHIRPGGPLVLVLMSPYCPIEVLAHLLRGRFQDAFRRLGDGVDVDLGAQGQPTRVWYPSPRRLSAELLPWFARISLHGLGVLLPPSYLSRRLETRRRLLGRLARLDRWAGAFFPGTWLNDHFIAVFRRTSVEVTG